MLPALHLPPLVTLGFAVALVLSFGSGMLALIADGFRQRLRHGLCRCSASP